MNLPKHALTALSLLFLLAWTGCAASPETQALGNYVNRDILGIVALENAAMKSYDAVVGKNFTSKQAVLEALDQEVIPVYERYLRLLSDIRIDDDEIARVHAVYVSGAEKILRGFKKKKFGIEADEEMMIVAGNRDIEEGVQETMRWRDMVLAMYDERDLNPADEPGGITNWLARIERWAMGLKE